MTPAQITKSVPPSWTGVAVEFGRPKRYELFGHLTETIHSEVNSMASLNHSRGNLKHGEGRVGKHTAEYRIWRSIKRRCLMPNEPAYPRYGGRGIIICDRWLESYEHFLADMGRRPSEDHSIDRFPDKNGNYEPGNCRWATEEQQQNNRNNNLLLTFNGKTMTARQWSRAIGIKAGTIQWRKSKGWSDERTLLQPVRPH